MTSANAELNGEFNQIQMKIEIEVKMGEKRHFKEKISKIYKKFHNVT